MKSQDGASAWDDDRVRSAYQAMAGGRRGPDATTALAVATALGRDRGSNFLRARPLGILAGLAATAAVVCVIGAAALYRSNQTARQNATTQPMTTLSVEQALATIAAGNLTGTDLITVHGWLGTPPMLGPCPTATQDGAFGMGCGGDIQRITQARGSDKPRLDAVVLPGTTLPEAITHRGAQPPEVVVIGHIHDLRAALCSADARSQCEAAFVIDQVASVDGKTFGPSVSVISGASGFKPSMSADQVIDAVGKVLQPGSTIVSLTAANLVDAVESYSPGLAPSGDGSVALWYVKVVGPPPSLFPMPGSHAGSGIVVYMEGGRFGSGGLRGAAGWGWDPLKAGVAMSDGTVSITTTNWLPGNACAGVGLDAVLRGSRDDPRIVWLENASPLPSWYSPDPNAPKPTVLWPARYRARFTPKVEIVDGAGNVVLREGDHIDGACGNNPETNTMYLEPPFR